MRSGSTHRVQDQEDQDGGDFIGRQKADGSQGYSAQGGAGQTRTAQERREERSGGAAEESHPSGRAE